VSARCPICRQPLPGKPTVAPFCTVRCRGIDLGQWLSGRYVVAGERHVDEQAVPATERGDEG